MQRGQRLIRLRQDSARLGSRQPEWAGQLQWMVKCAGREMSHTDL